MRAEKIVLSFVAVLIGVVVTGVAFYLYQETQKSSTDSKTIVISEPSPTPAPSVFLTIKSPTDEDVVTKKVVSVEGSTFKDATIVIVTPVDQEVLKPSDNGDFSTTVNIDDGENFIEITAISPNGEQTKTTRTVTFSTEDF